MFVRAGGRKNSKSESLGEGAAGPQGMGVRWAVFQRLAQLTSHVLLLCQNPKASLPACVLMAKPSVSAVSACTPGRSSHGLWEEQS